MNMRPAEDDLHAYVDGQLDPTRREQVEHWLAAHPEQAERVRGWQELNVVLRDAFDPVLSETPPENLQRIARRAPRQAVWRAAAAVGWMALGGMIGYGVQSWRPAQPPAAPPALAHSAAIAHAVYVPEVRHPVEVGADQEAHLVQWLSKRLATPLKVPHLATEGFALVGGRLLPGEQGPVAQFMYEDGSGKRLTLYVRGDAAENRETAFRFAQEGRVGVFYWLDGKLGYALSGELPREKLLAVADAAYRQLNER
jgi:anti-sigma factor RsiW